MITDLNTGDLARAQVAILDSMSAMNYEYQTMQDSVIENLTLQVKHASDYISDTDAELTEQIAANNRLNREIKKERRRTWLIGAGLLVALIITNL